jgi:hypothetical protein
MLRIDMCGMDSRIRDRRSGQSTELGQETRQGCTEVLSGTMPSSYRQDGLAAASMTDAFYCARSD